MIGTLTRHWHLDWTLFENALGKNPSRGVMKKRVWKKVIFENLIKFQSESCQISKMGLFELSFSHQVFLEKDPS